MAIVTLYTGQVVDVDFAGGTAVYKTANGYSTYAGTATVSTIDRIYNVDIKNGQQFTRCKYCTRYQLISGGVCDGCGAPL